MEELNQFFIDYGAIGMFLCAYIAGSFLPFSSEAVLIALLATTSVNPWSTLISASVGNILGSMTNYYIGTKGDVDKIAKWFHVNPARLRKVKIWTSKYGGWMGFLTFLPIIGTLISLSLGLLKCNVLTVFFTTSVGKFVRYFIIVFAMGAI